MHDNNETSYYEIALTNRQVVIAFVLILGALLAAFLSGVWIGRQDGGSRFAAPTGEPVGETEVADLERPDELGFFADDGDTAGEDGDENLDKPDLSRLLDEPRAETTLAEDVGAAAPPRRASNEDSPPGAASGEDELPLWKKRALAKKAERDEAERRSAQPAPPPAAAPPPTAAPPPSAAPPPAASAPPPVASAPPAAEPGVKEGFVIQVFSTHDQPQARKVHDDLEAGGFEVFMSPVVVDGRSMYRVRIGPFADRDEATEVAERVNRRFKLDTWVTAASH